MDQGDHGAEGVRSAPTREDHGQASDLEQAMEDTSDMPVPAGQIPDGIYLQMQPPPPPLQLPQALAPHPQGLLQPGSSHGSAMSMATSQDESSPVDDEEQELSGEEDEPEPEQPPQRQAMPSTHAYLGEARSDTVRSRRDLEAGAIVEIPILPLRGVVLFPGEALPLRLTSSYAELVQSMLSDGGRAGSGRENARSRRVGEAGIQDRRDSESSAIAAGHLGVVNLQRWRPDRPSTIQGVGTTAEIRWGHEDAGDEEEELPQNLAVMARGRHRFKLLEDRGWRNGVWYYSAVICPDLCPPWPLQAPVPRSFRELPSVDNNNDTIWNSDKRKRGYGHPDVRGDGARRHRAGSCPHWVMSTPRFIVAMNSPEALAARAACLLRRARDSPGPATKAEDKARHAMAMAIAQSETAASDLARRREAFEVAEANCDAALANRNAARQEMNESIAKMFDVVQTQLSMGIVAEVSAMRSTIVGRSGSGLVVRAAKRAVEAMRQRVFGTSRDEEEEDEDEEEEEEEEGVSQSCLIEPLLAQVAGMLDEERGGNGEGEDRVTDPVAMEEEASEAARTSVAHVAEQTLEGRAAGGTGSGGSSSNVGSSSSNGSGNSSSGSGNSSSGSSSGGGSGGVAPAMSEDVIDRETQTLLARVGDLFARAAEDAFVAPESEDEMEADAQATASGGEMTVCTDGARTSPGGSAGGGDDDDRAYRGGSVRGGEAVAGADDSRSHAHSPRDGGDRVIAQDEDEDCRQEGADIFARAKKRLARRLQLEPTLYSFWLAANLPLNDEARQALLEVDSVVGRLRLEVRHLEEEGRRELCCSTCRCTVAWDRDVFAMPGAEGAVGAYVNPAGSVHQTVTVRRIQRGVLDGSPQVEHSWFPGYAWTLLYCENCEEHLGWRFTRAPPLVPAPTSTGGVEDNNDGGGDQHARAASPSQLVGVAGDSSGSARVGDGDDNGAGGDGDDSVDDDGDDSVDDDGREKSPRVFYGLRRTALFEKMSNMQ